MPLLVLNPAVPISGALTPVTSGLSVYNAGYKQDQTPPGSPVYEYWGQRDANTVGEAILDIVNSGTVVLFGYAAASTASVADITATIAAMNALSSTMSGNLNLSSSKLTTLSGVVGNWTGTAPYLGPTAANASSTLTGSVSASLAYIYRIASASQGSNAGLQGQADALSLVVNSGSPNLSATVWGDGGGGGGVSGWTLGISGTLSALSKSYYGPHITGVMNAIGALGEMLVGVADMDQIASGTGGSTGSHPTATFYNLREGFYDLTATFNGLSSTLNTSASKWNTVSSSYTALSGNFASLSNSYYPMSSSYAALSNSYVALSGGAGNASLTSPEWNPTGGVFKVTGSVVASGGLYVSGTTIISGGVNITGAIGITSSLVTVTSTINVSGAVNVSGGVAAFSVSGTSGTFQQLTATFSSGTYFSGTSGTFQQLIGTYTSGTSGTFQQLTGVFFSGTSGTLQQLTATFHTGTYFSGTSGTFQQLTGTYFSGTSGTLQRLTVSGSEIRGPAFGDLSFSGSTTIGLSTAWTKWTASLTASLSDSFNNVVPRTGTAEGRIHLSASGYYRVTSQAAWVTNGTQNVYVGLFQTGSEVIKLTQHQTSDGTNHRQITLTGIVSASADDFIDIRFKVDTGTPNFTLYHMEFDCSRVV